MIVKSLFSGNASRHRFSVQLTVQKDCRIFGKMRQKKRRQNSRQTVFIIPAGSSFSKRIFAEVSAEVLQTCQSSILISPMPVTALIVFFPSPIEIFLSLLRVSSPTVISPIVVDGVIV